MNDLQKTTMKGVSPNDIRRGQTEPVGEGNPCYQKWCYSFALWLHEELNFCVSGQTSNVPFTKTTDHGFQAFNKYEETDVGIGDHFRPPLGRLSTSLLTCVKNRSC